jgi:hypothetical protein
MEDHAYAVDLAKSGRTSCSRSSCSNSKKKHGKIPKGAARWSSQLPERHINRWYCLRPTCLSKDSVLHMEETGNYPTLKDIPGMSDLPEAIQDAIVQVITAIRDESEPRDESLQLLGWGGKEGEETHEQDQVEGGEEDASAAATTTATSHAAKRQKMSKPRARKGSAKNKKQDVADVAPAAEPAEETKANSAADK